MPHVATTDESQPNRVDAPTSFALATDNPRIKMHACYTNSVSVLLHDYQNVLPAGTRYVEGWVLWRGEIPIEHGWLQAPDGTVYDVTLAYLLETYETLALHKYIAVKAFTVEEIVTYINDNTNYDEDTGVSTEATFPILSAFGYAYTREDWYWRASQRMLQILKGEY